jgi:predicted nucleotide-binding protein (sugar kinase/HSP70/actin superfamily)
MSVAHGNIQEDFFDQNSELTLLPEIKKLLENEDRKTASKIMWSIYLMEDPDSIFYRIPREERVAEIQQEYYNFKPEEYKSLITEYCRFILTKKQWMLKAIQDSAENQIMRLSTDSNLDNQLKILERMPKIFKGIEEIEKQMKEEGAKTQIKGQAREGAREIRKRKVNDKRA